MPLQLRVMRREPGFCAAIVLLLGMGIASTCLLLTAIDRLLLRPIDVPYAESLVRAAVLEPKGMVYTFFPYQVYAEFERETKTVSAIAADANLDVAISRGGMPQPAVRCCSPPPRSTACWLMNSADARGRSPCEWRWARRQTTWLC